MPDPSSAFTLEPASLDDFNGIWAVVHEVLSTTNTYCYDPALSCEEAKAIFFAPNVQQFKAVVNGEIAGFFYLRPNFHKRGNHVANAGFMVGKKWQGLGIGRALGQKALDVARTGGFTAMQFNSVMSTNKKAVALWQDLGFEIIGTVPKAYQHDTLGLVDVYVMHRFL